MLLDLGITWSFMSRPFYRRSKSLWCPLDRRLGRPQNQSGRCGVETISYPYRISKTNSKLVAIPTELVRYKCKIDNNRNDYYICKDMEEQC
jgi:hypothetical protein